jgi:hypothetical protein
MNTHIQLAAIAKDIATPDGSEACGSPRHDKSSLRPVQSLSRAPTTRPERAKTPIRTPEDGACPEHKETATTPKPAKRDGEFAHALFPS